MRKFTEENKQLAAQLHEQMKALQGKPAPSASKAAKSKGRANGSDFSSARGSEERGSMAAQGGGRAPRRLRDYDLEQVCEFLFFVLFAIRTPSWCEFLFSGAPLRTTTPLDLNFAMPYVAEKYACTQVRTSANFAECGRIEGLFTTQPTFHPANFENSNNTKLELQHTTNPRKTPPCRNPSWSIQQR